MPSNTLLFSYGANQREVHLDDNVVALEFKVPVDRESMWQGREAYDLMKHQSVRDALSDEDLRAIDDLVALIDHDEQEQTAQWSKLTQDPRPDSDKYVAVYFTIDHHA